MPARRPVPKMRTDNSSHHRYLSRDSAKSVDAIVEHADLYRAARPKSPRQVLAEKQIAGTENPTSSEMIIADDTASFNGLMTLRTLGKFGWGNWMAECRQRTALVGSDIGKANNKFADVDRKLAATVDRMDGKIKSGLKSFAHIAAEVNRALAQKDVNLNSALAQRDADLGPQQYPRAGRRQAQHQNRRRL